MMDTGCDSKACLPHMAFLDEPLAKFAAEKAGRRRTPGAVAKRSVAAGADIHPMWMRGRGRVSANRLGNASGVWNTAQRCHGGIPNGL